MLPCDHSVIKCCLLSVITHLIRQQVDEYKVIVE